MVDSKHRFLLQAVYDYFREHAAWPSARRLEIDLEDRLDPLGGLEQVCMAIGTDRIICWSSNDPGGVCRLRLAGFAECHGTDDDIGRFLGAVRYCAKKYRDAAGANVAVSAGAFVGDLGYSEHEARRVALMLLDASDLWTTATQPPEAWPSFTPAPLARSMKDVASLQEFFEVVRADEERQRAAALGRSGHLTSSKQKPKQPKPKPKQPKQKRYDVFIAYAYEDKHAVARPLAEALKENLAVWYDDFALQVGDSLRREIERGLASSRYGVVILSPNFFKKEWPQKELDGLAAREVEGRKIVLPVWHEIDAEGVRRVAPSLADKVAARTSDGIGAVAAKLLQAMTEGNSPMPSPRRTSTPATASVSSGAGAALVAQSKYDERTSAVDAHIRVVALQVRAQLRRERSGRSFGELLGIMVSRGVLTGDLMATWLTTIAAEAPQASSLLRSRASELSNSFFSIVDRREHLRMTLGGNIPDDDAELAKDFQRFVKLLDEIASTD